MASITTVTQKIINKNKQNTVNSTKEQLVYGTVTSVAPIKVKISSKLTLTEGKNLLISSLCKPPLLQGGLRVGNKLRILSLNNNQIYYAIEKG